jgi:hypothetical protein
MPALFRFEIFSSKLQKLTIKTGFLPADIAGGRSGNLADIQGSGRYR